MVKLKCPNCSQEISFFAFARAPTPWHMKCDKCETKLKQESYKWTLMLIAVCFGMVLGGVSAFAAMSMGGLIIGIAVFVAGLFLFEGLVFRIIPMLDIRLVVRNR
jgi:hypothetical protein